MRRIKEAYGDRLTVRWKSFSLEQVNNKEGAGWKLWEQPDGYPSRGLLAFRAAQAASRQGQDAFNRFHIALLQARHEQGQDLSDQATISQVAREAGLDMATFERDMADRALLQKIGEEHQEGAERFGVFGTPTLVFTDGLGAYLKMKPAPPAEESLEVFQELYSIMAKRPYILEVKRPR